MENKSMDQEMYVVSTSHLDTVWSWNLEQDILEYLPQTFTENFEMMDAYPEYKFNFEGAYRYQLLREYYPQLFEQLKKYTANGQWNVAGSALENGDVNVPSPEALFRNILYGNNYFDKHFGQRSRDIYLPDCFGFGYALPSVIAHGHLQGFATQKLHWGVAVPDGKLPFDIGLWQGPDGEKIVGDINLNDYNDTFDNGFRTDDYANQRLEESPVPATSLLYGSPGDRGGTVPRHSIHQMCDEIRENDKHSVKIRSARVDDLIKKLYADPTGLDTYDGELLMHTHGSGAYTSQAIGKRWNRKAELLGYAAEQANVTAAYLGLQDYSNETFEADWTRVIAHQFHDDITGTSNAETYLRSRNDYMISNKRFAAAYEASAGAVVGQMDTSGEGVALVAHNPLAFARHALVEGELTLSDGVTEVQVLDDAGMAVPAQITRLEGDRANVVFAADLPAFGYRVYHLVPGKAQESVLKVTENSLENERYLVSIDQNGDIAQVYDKVLTRNLLSAPIRLALIEQTDCHWAAWEVKMEDYTRPPVDYVGGTPEVRIAERGPARVALEITRKNGKSTYRQTVSLSQGGQAVRVDNLVDWQERARLLKCEFPMAAVNPQATYDLGLGAISRSTNLPYKAEVPMQRWADLTDQGGQFGVAVFNDCKYGMDKPSDNLLRLTLIHTPKSNFGHQSAYGPSGQDQQDVGENRFAFAICGHGPQDDIAAQAEAFNQPAVLFAADAHPGALGSCYSFGAIDNKQIIVRALKKAECSNEIILRVNEMSGSAQTGTFTLGDGILSAREMYASEEEIGPAVVKDGKLQIELSRYGVKTYALTLAPAAHPGKPAAQRPLELPFNADAYSYNENRQDGGINALGETYPAELVPDAVTFAGIRYPMGEKADGKLNALRCQGQTLSLPAGYKTLHLLAVSVNGDKTADFVLDNRTVTLTIGDYSENIGAGDTAALLMTGYVKPQTPAFVATHRHTAGRDSVANTTYMFTYALDLSGCSKLTLPNDPDLLIFSAVCGESAPVACATPLTDRREREADSETLMDPRYLKTWDSWGEQAVASHRCEFTHFEGKNALKLSGTADGENARVYYNLLSLNPVWVQPGTLFRYKLYAADENGCYVAPDLMINDGIPLRDREDGVDQNGNRMHPSAKKGKAGQWVEVVCRLGDTAAGQKVTTLFLGLDGAPAGDFTAYLADLEIVTPAADLKALLETPVELADCAKSSAEACRLAEQYAKRVLEASDATQAEYDFAANNLEMARHFLTPKKDGRQSIDVWSYSKMTGNLYRRQQEDGAHYLGGIDNASSATYRGVDFGDAPVDTVVIEYAADETGKNPQITVIDGDNDGRVAALFSTPETGGWEKYVTISCKLNRPLTGEHDITLNFKGRHCPTIHLRKIWFE